MYVRCEGEALQVIKGNCWFYKSVETCFWRKFHNTFTWTFRLMRALAVTERQQNKLNSLPHQPHSARVIAVCILLLL